YACQGGVDFPNLIAAIKDSPADIWSPLVKANYSDLGDGKAIALLTAASIIRQTAEIAGSFEASARTEDANLYMIVVQVQLISTTISGLGQADRTTGNEGIAGWPATSGDMYRCRIQSAVSTIQDSLEYVESSTNLQTLSNAITTLCVGSCSTNRDPEGCSAADNLEGLALMNGISADWTGP
ncbi:MAG TPA: hypothetical protein PLH57_09375, partial [Oligoflexia bacterium]|nr:hypothetical protein [Oligoflexia bacterium]